MNKNLKCPNCGSYATQKVTPAVLGLSLILSACIFGWIPFVGLVMMPILLILGVICIILSPFINEYGCKCKSCKYSWKHKKVGGNEETKEFEIGDQVIVFVEDNIKSGIIANINDKRTDKYLVMFDDTDLNDNAKYFSDDEMSFNKNT